MEEVIEVRAGLDVRRDSIAIRLAEPERMPGRVLSPRDMDFAPSSISAGGGHQVLVQLGAG